MLTEEQKTQGTPEWKAIRREKITASDLAKILGISPYGTKLDLYNAKVGGQETPWNPALKDGQKAEFEIRRWYEEKSGEWFMPVVDVHPDGWALASLDGINLDRSKILECKFCNKEVFEAAQKGEVVPHYMTQIQWQLFCFPEAQEVHYVCYHDCKYAVVIVKRDEALIENLVVVGKDFYNNHLTAKVSPEPTSKDYVTIDNPEAMLIAEELKNVKRVKANATLKEKALKERLIEFTDDGNCNIGPLKLTRTGGKIKVDYKKACVDNDIDLKKYTAQGIGYYTIREIKEKNG